MRAGGSVACVRIHAKTEAMRARACARSHLLFLELRNLLLFRFHVPVTRQWSIRCVCSHATYDKARTQQAGRSASCALPRAVWSSPSTLPPASSAPLRSALKRCGTVLKRCGTECNDHGVSAAGPHHILPNVQRLLGLLVQLTNQRRDHLHQISRAISRRPHILAHAHERLRRT